MARWQDELGPKVLVMQIIVGALAMGCLTFAGIATFVGLDGGAANKTAPGVLSFIALGFLLGALAARFVVPQVIVSSERRRLAGLPADEEQLAQQLCAIYQTSLIVAGALLEGPTFFLLIAYMTEGWLGTLVVAGMMILVQVAHVPTVGRVTDWIENQLAQIAMERNLDRR